MYQIVIERNAEKQLAKIPNPHFNRIVRAINDLADNPRPHGYKKLTGKTRLQNQLWRLPGALHY